MRVLLGWDVAPFRTFVLMLQIDPEGFEPSAFGLRVRRTAYCAMGRWWTAATNLSQRP